MGSGRKYQKLGDQASEKFLKEGVDLNEEIQKIANDNDLNSHEVQRVVEHANVNTFLSQFKEADDKTFGFDVAKPDVIDPPAETTTKESSSSMSEDYKTPPELTESDKFEKKAGTRAFHKEAELDENRSLDEWVDHLKEAGVPDDRIDRFKRDWERQINVGKTKKEAAAGALHHVPDYALDDYTPDIDQKDVEKFAFDNSELDDFFDNRDFSRKKTRMRVRSKLASVLSREKDKLGGLRAEGKDLIDKLAHDLVSTAKKGYTFDSLHDAVKEAADDYSEIEDFVKSAFDKARQRELDIEEWKKSRGVSNKTKTSAVNRDHSIFESVHEISEWTQKVSGQKDVISELDNAINELVNYES